MKITKPQIGAVLILVILHGVGLWGLNNEEYTSLFMALTPVNLLISAAVIFSFHKKWNPGFIVFLLLAALIGFAVEWLGVETGVIFGQYQYHHGLGFKILDVPLLIGLNWAMLIYCTGVISSSLTTNIIFRILTGAALMVAIDVFIEPYAIRYEMWSWNSAVVPMRNYIAWFAISVLLHILYQKLEVQKTNKVAHLAYMVMFLFFLTDFMING